MNRAAMSTIGHGLRHEIEDDLADAQFTGFYAAAAIREASMLVERNEPIRDGFYLHNHCFRGPIRMEFEGRRDIGLWPTHDAAAALAEALAAFIVADLA